MGEMIRVTDNFNRADVNPLTGVWSTPTGWPNGGQIVSNQLRSGAPGEGGMFYNADTPPSDHYSKLKFISTANAGSDLDDGGPCVRFGVNGNGYLFNVNSNDTAGPDSTWVLFKLTAGVGANLTSGLIGRALISGDILECRAVGTTISGWLNSVQIGSTIDATYPSGGYGVHIFGSAGTPPGGVWDDFEGGDFLPSVNRVLFIAA